MVLDEPPGLAVDMVALEVLLDFAETQGRIDGTGWDGPAQSTQLGKRLAAEPIQNAPD